MSGVVFSCPEKISVVVRRCPEKCPEMSGEMSGDVRSRFLQLSINVRRDVRRCPDKCPEMSG
jgi:hypothetical protein